MLKTNKSLLALLILGLTASLYLQAQDIPAETHEESSAAVQPSAPSDAPASTIPKLVAAAPEQNPVEAAEQNPVEAAKPADSAKTEELIAALTAAPATEPSDSAQAQSMPSSVEGTDRIKTPAAAEAVKPETGKSQSFEESFGLIPSTPVEAKPIHLPEIAHLETQPTEETVQDKTKESEQVKKSDQTVSRKPEAVTAVKQPAQSDDETCTTICKKVCLALKEEDRKKLEEEAPTSEEEK